MEPQVYRFRRRRILLELCLVGAAGGLLFLALDGEVDRRILESAGPALVGIALLLLTVFRWRSRIVFDQEGVEGRRSRDRGGTRLAWGEVDELFLLGASEFELRGAGKAVRVSRRYRVPWNARDLCSERLGGLRQRLRDRALQDGVLVFRMPVPRLKAHVAYLLAILFLTGVTGLLLAPLFHRGRIGLPIFILFGGSWLWGLRRRASRMGTVVHLYRDGLLIRRLDGRDKVAWSDLAATEWDGKGGLVLTLRTGRKIPLPPSLANIALLEEFAEESRGTATAR
jgi:hypothetical protein